MMRSQQQLDRRDGTSQAMRFQKALQPDYVSVDERSIKDLLVFSMKYARELNYFNEQNAADGDWSGFLGNERLDEIVAFMEDPERFSMEAEKRDWLTRPHLTLFITFLELVQYACQQLNGLTRRHLEFFYREALQLATQPGTPDHIHALIKLANDQDDFLLPAGTLFVAGKDSHGKDLFYRSDEDLVANQAAVSSLKSLYVENQIIGIREARLNPDLLINLFPENKAIIKEGSQQDRAFLGMLMMALGDPNPGNKLKPYIDADGKSHTVNESFLKVLDQFLDFIQSELFMPASAFRLLMQLKWDLTIGGDAQKQINREWDAINNRLKKIGAQQNPDLQAAPDHFEANLLSTLGLTNFDGFFKELPDVKNVYNLYHRLKQKNADQQFLDFVQNSIHMEKVDDFMDLMSMVEEINGRWRQVYEILRSAGRKKYIQDPNHVFDPPRLRDYAENKFDSLVQKTLGAINYSSVDALTLKDLDTCFDELRALESQFHMQAEKFIRIRAINARAQQGLEIQPWEWEQVYEILEAAHQEHVLASRRDEIRSKKDFDGFDEMIRFALGYPEPGENAKKFADLDVNKDRAFIQDKLFLAPENFSFIQNVAGKDSGNPAWEAVYMILATAWRRSQNPDTLRAAAKEWRNVYAAEDATLIQVRTGTEGDTSTPRWKTFGQGFSKQQEGEPQTVPAAIGLAVSSPILFLAQGTRAIRLTLEFQEESFNDDRLEGTLKDAFRFLLGTEKEYIEIVPEKVESLKDQHAIQIGLVLSEQTPPITAVTTGSFQPSSWPVLQILLADIEDPATGGAVKHYRAFRDLKLEKVSLQVEVDGITDLIMQNDERTLDAGRPFTPFGISPVEGSSFYFAHPELCAKKLTRIRLNIDWLGAPKDFTEYYKGYDLAKPEFKAQLSLYNNRSFGDLGVIPLFSTDTKTSDASPLELGTLMAGYSSYKQNVQPASSHEVIDWERFWRLELLSPDFQHSNYAKVAATQAGAKDKDGKPAPVIVNPPYTPKIKKLSAGYTASVEIDLTKAGLDAGLDRIFHVEPFGYRPITSSEKPLPFLPQFENEGELLIGITKLSPPQNLSILFQLAEGSADPDLEKTPVRWHVLSGDRWLSLDQGQLLSDTTNGLLNAGMIKFNLAPVKPSTCMPAGFYWLRASVPANSRSIADTIAVKTQAVSATFEDHGNAPDHLSQPLPAETISGLAESQSQVDAVQQPYSSFGGRKPELAPVFYTRVSERLRHKDRALTCWDYEHIVLEAFPEIYKVKCLPVGSSDDPHVSDVIQVVVIPDIRGKLPLDPFEPKTSSEQLWKIEQYLLKHAPPYAQIRVRNPSYMKIRLRLNVRFRQGFNPGFYTLTLNRELQQFLSPWAYDQGAEIFFGGSINISLIINYVEERPYIDYVAGLKAFLIPADQSAEEAIPYFDADPADPTQARENLILQQPDLILVSDQAHQIDQITEAAFAEEFFTGIGYMKIGLDFKVA